MYANTVTLTGFLGADAETRTGKNNSSFVTFQSPQRPPGKTAKPANGSRGPNGIEPWYPDVSPTLPQAS